MKKKKPIYVETFIRNDLETVWKFSKWFSIKLPISEHFTVWEEEDYLKANHEMWILGKKFLTIDYSIYSVSTE
ncbi:hypothetical protein [Oceanobacillus kimchii]|uniref:GNAT family N-acetyltransferase n=1 Tax=Oceanobacillus kimchii TaxID=746691 RepID=A0ABQ5TGN5_9BACI|nr:hypothetical protein [Oceanobacillus kimchii]GLO65190.1 hypothetical protein MACH08_09740 [Oceanobacillus kimchii]